MWRDWIWWGPVVVLVVFWIIYALANRRANPFSIIYGADGRPSTSKLQFFLWTVVALYSYLAVWIARLAVKEWRPTSDIPQNLLIAMGLSATAAIGAKAITVQYINNSQGSKTHVSQTSGAGKALGWGPIFQDDNGFVDLTKVQMMAWTVIALAVYIMQLVHQVNAAVAIGPAPASCPKHCPTGWPPAGWPPSLPDIDTALMVLTGLSAGTYLGKKLVTTTMPQLLNVKPAVGPAGAPITLTGSGFGTSQAQGGSLLTINGQPYFAAIANGAWTDSEISTTIPDTKFDGSDWQGDDTLLIGVIVGGQESNRRPFTIQPQLLKVEPDSGPVRQMITLTGIGFGTKPGVVIMEYQGNISKVAVANAKTNWTETEIHVAIPDKRPDKTDWQGGDVLSIRVNVGKQESDSLTFTIQL